MLPEVKLFLEQKYFNKSAFIIFYEGMQLIKKRKSVCNIDSIKYWLSCILCVNCHFKAWNNLNL
jgi:hypothetical protein